MRDMRLFPARPVGAFDLGVIFVIMAPGGPAGAGGIVFGPGIIFVSKRRKARGAKDESRPGMGACWGPCLEGA